MNLISVFNQFPDQQSCIAHLEQIRWADDPFCPLCGDHDVARKAENQRVGRWNCHGCKSSFNVLSGTIFQKTKIPLQKWFLAISLMANAKKSLSSHQLARDLELNQKAAWFMQQRIRAAMASDEGALLQGIIEADETYLGGKPRKSDKNNKRGRGTGKTSIVGAVEREGEVRATVTDDTKGRTVLDFIEQSVEVEESSLITDEYKACTNAYKLMPHRTVNHSAEEFVAPDDKTLHTNTIEGFWSLLKRAWYGSHHKYTKGWSPLFVAEAAWKYNQRKNPDAFNGFLRACFA